METLDVTDLPKSKVGYLKQLIEQWREEGLEKAKEKRPRLKAMILTRILSFHHTNPR